VVTDSSWCEPNGKTHCTITGENGVLSVGISTQSLELSLHGKAKEMLDFPLSKDFSLIASASRGGYVAQMASFIDAFSKGETPGEGVAEGTNILRLVAAAYACHAKGAPVVPGDVPLDVPPIEIARGGA
jgi:predicted dehydrogenase